MDWNDIPRILRHMVVAVHAKQGGAGTAGVISAFKISRSCLEKNGYLYRANFGEAVLDDIHLTAKGTSRNNKHHRESATEAKDLAFKQLFKQIEPIIYELDGPGGKQPPSTVYEEESKRAAGIKIEDE